MRLVNTLRVRVHNLQKEDSPLSKYVKLIRVAIQDHFYEIVFILYAVLDGNYRMQLCL